MRAAYFQERPNRIVGNARHPINLPVPAQTEVSLLSAARGYVAPLALYENEAVGRYPQLDRRIHPGALRRLHAIAWPLEFSKQGHAGLPCVDVPAATLLRAGRPDRGKKSERFGREPAVPLWCQRG